MSETAAPAGLFDRAIRRIANVWRDMAASVSEEDEGIAAQMRACLAARGGEVSARNRAAKLAQTYLALDAEERVAFLKTLAEFDSDPEAVARAYEAVQAARDPAERAALYEQAQQLILGGHYLLPLYDQQNSFLLSANVQGARAMPTVSTPSFSDAWLID